MRVIFGKFLCEKQFYIGNLSYHFFLLEFLDLELSLYVLVCKATNLILAILLLAIFLKKLPIPNINSSPINHFCTVLYYYYYLRFFILLLLFVLALRFPFVSGCFVFVCCFVSFQFSFTHAHTDGAWADFKIFLMFKVKLCH